MGMHQGIDLRNFKKISADKKMTTLRHSKGQGGDVEEMDDDSPEDVSDDSTPEDAAEEPAADSESAVPDTGNAPEMPEAEAARERVDTAPSPPPKPSNLGEMGDRNTIPVSGQRRLPPTPQELDNEDALFAQDLQRGHIKKETVQDLFAKKDTLGKISTAFGLLIGGFGAGLTHTENPVLQMMNNEINNDYQAQFKSNENAQNWLRLSQQHEMQKAQIGQIGADVDYKKAQTSKAPSEIEQIKAATQAHLADANFRAAEATKIKMQIAALNHLQNEVDNMSPEGQAAAAPALSQVAQKVQQNISATNAKTAAVLGMRAAARGDPLPQPAIDWKKFQILQAAGAASATSGITSIPGKSLNPQQAAEAQQEAGKIQANRSLYSNYKNAFETLDSRNAAGRLNEESYKAITSPIVAQMTQGMPAAEAEKLGQAIFPSWKDWGKAREDKSRFGYDHFQTMESNTPITTAYGLKTPFPPPPEIRKKAASKESAAEPKQTQALKDGMTGKAANGHAIIVKNGKWVYQ